MNFCSRIPLETLVAYRLHVGTFTGEAENVDETSRGTFLGVLEKIPYLRSLGASLCIHERYLISCILKVQYAFRSVFFNVLEEN